MEISIPLLLAGTALDIATIGFLIWRHRRGKAHRQRRLGLAQGHASTRGAILTCKDARPLRGRNLMARLRRGALVLGLAFAFSTVAPELAQLAGFKAGEAFVSKAHAYALPRFIRGRLICARNTVRFLRANGRHVAETASSRFFLRFHRISRQAAHMGDVRFNFRHGGGHVQPVLGWQGGQLMCLNPSSRKQRWEAKACPAGGIYVRPA